MLSVFKSQTVSVSVGFKISPHGGPDSRMTRIHVHSSNFSNPGSPSFSQPALCLIVGALLTASFERDLKESALLVWLKRAINSPKQELLRI